MKILFVSSEVAPFAKSGGLGDVGAALPRALAARGHDVRVVLPCYRRVWEGGHDATGLLPRLEVDLGHHRLGFETLETRLPGSEVPVYLVHCPPLYDRPSIYTQDADEHLRFALLSWAALRIAQQLAFAPDVIHVNDWQTALLPLIRRVAFSWDRLFDHSRTVLTLHNLGHQGTFPAQVLPELGLAGAADAFHQDQLREGRLSFLLTGLLYADAITTVSPTYAREILRPEHGVGMDGFLRARGDVLFGILNGIDPEEWSPATDPHLPTHYSAEDPAGKALCKQALLAELGLPAREGVPLIGVVSRLVWQKGFDLCEAVLPGVLARRAAQLVVLGSGEPRYEAFFSHLARVAPDRVAFRNGFSEALAHRIEAGSDLFLMPSRYEPCGLNQMYSLAYGTPPIVHRTGGLADTVELYDPDAGTGTGFVFDHFDSRGLQWALEAALDTYDDAEAWAGLIVRGMLEENGWSHRVPEYESLYRALLP
ncbi:MAG: glycogen synthase GlgA [Deltaproteobacteria bacterium]|nr:glycogen synthase GlgA [Deltaproteobacteria bacterium]